MELSEALLRILRHSRMIITIVVACVAIAVFSAWRGDDTYVSSARVSFGPDPSSEEEAAAMVDTAEAIVTTPGAIDEVLSRRVGGRDPASIEDQVDVESVGVSGVLVISVEDTDPTVATVVANGLARRFLEARRALVLEPLTARLTEVEERLFIVGEEVRAITRTAVAEDAVDTRRLQLDAALSRQNGLRAERERLNTTLESTPEPKLLARAMTPTSPEPSGLAADVAVAGLLGLIIGVALAAVSEAFRPTIVGRDALAGALGGPVLGEIPDPWGKDADPPDDGVALPMTLAARNAKVDVVHLTGVGPEIDLAAVAEGLDAAAPGVTVDTLVAPLDDPPVSPRRRSGEGLVVVAPEVQLRRGLHDVEQLLAVSRWPLVGVITYPTSIWRRHPGPGPVRSRLRQARVAIAAWFERRRQTPQHAGPADPARRSALPAIRRLLRAPSAVDPES